MGFLTSAASGDDQDQGGSGNEELYDQLFPKIGRDYLTKRDFQNMMQRLMFLLDPAGLLPIDWTDDSEARKLALEYKAVLDAGDDGTELFTDLIDLDD